MKNFENEIWIDTYGKIYRWTGDKELEIISAHYEIAHELYPDAEHPQDVLMKLGWIKVSCINGITAFKEPTQSQLNTLWDEFQRTEVRIVTDI